MTRIIRLQEGQIHSISSVARRPGSSYWARFRPEGDQLPLNNLCGIEQFEQLNPRGVLVDGFIPMGHRRALILWRVPDTILTYLAFVNFPDRLPVQFKRLRIMIDDIVLDHAFLGNDLALLTATRLWRIDLSKGLPETAELILPGLEGQQLWSNHHNRLYILESLTTGAENQTIITSLLMDHGRLVYPSPEPPGLDPGEEILTGTAGAGKLYLLSRTAEGSYLLWIQPEPEQPKSEIVDVMSINALLAASAPELNQQKSAIKSIAFTVLGDTLHLLVCHQQALWWGLLGPDGQLLQSNKTKLALPAEVTINGAEFVVEKDKITAVCTGTNDYGQPYWALSGRNLPLASSQAGTYTTPVMIMTGLLLSQWRFFHM